VLLVAVAATAASAQAPVINAVVERRQAAQPVAREVQAVADRGAVSWVGYRVPMARVAGMTVRSSDTCCGRCRLEPPTELVVLARVEAKTLVEIRPIAVDCDVDAAGMPLVWLDGVKPDDSVAWLASLATGTAPPRRVADSALVALAQHASPAAAPELVRVAREAMASGTRTQALFWLAQRAAQRAIASVDATSDADPDTEVKKQAVLALSRLPRDEGIPRLIEVARTHRNLEVRRQAMFWLGQSRDVRAVDFFAEILLK
jgi:HEAT repeat protein